MNIDNSELTSPDDDDDDHYCLKCKVIIRGLSHYIDHRKTKCVTVEVRMVYN